MHGDSEGKMGHGVVWRHRLERATEAAAAARTQQLRVQATTVRAPQPVERE